MNFIVTILLTIVFLFKNGVFSIANALAEIEKEILMEGREIFIDEKTKNIIANGEVEFQYNQKLFKADRVLFNQSQGLIFASGNIEVKDLDTKSIFIAHNIKILKDRYKAKLFGLKAKINPKGFLLTASEVQVIAKNQYSFRNLTFSPCKICASNWVPFTPLWQLRAKKVYSDLEESFYYETYLDFWGKPILYLPYFKTPSIHTNRMSGFLIPKLYGGQGLGVGIGIPYYFNLSQNLDFTLTPYFSTKQNINILESEIRQAFNNGGYIMRYFLAKDNYSLDNKIQYNGYLYGRGSWLLNSTKSNELGFYAQMLAGEDKTFLKRYNLTNADILISNIYWQNIKDNDYLIGESYNIQDLREPSYATTIFALPRIRWQKSLPLKKFIDSAYISDNSLILLDANLVNLYSTSNIDYKHARFSAKASNNWITNYGHIIEIIPNIEFNLYSTQSKSQGALSNISPSSDRYQIIPQLNISWRWPLYNNDSSSNNKNESYSNLRLVTLEPTVNIKLAPKMKLLNPLIERKFLLLNPNALLNPGLRTSNLDQDYMGNSIEYGIKGSVFTQNYKLEFILGNSIRFYKPTVLEPLGSSVYKNNSSISEFILSNSVKFTNLFVSNKLWISHKEKKITRDEFDIIYNLKKFEGNLNYTFMDHRYYGMPIDINYNQELMLGLWYNIYQNWWLNIKSNTKLGEKIPNNSRKVSEGLGVSYRNDCLRVDLAISKNYLTFKELKPSTTYTLNLKLPFLN